MPSQPSKSSQFSQEIKRRIVNNVIAVYTWATCVLFELAGTMVETLNLPDGTLRLVILS